MFRVTVLAGRERVNGVHAPMWRHQVLHLSRNILVAHQTAVLHGLVFPRCCVTGTASACNFSMGGHTANQVTMDVVECSRAKHLAAACKGKPYNG